MYHNSCGAFFGKEEGHVLELGTGGYRMRGMGEPICDSYRDAQTGLQIASGGFLDVERGLLESRGRMYSPFAGAHFPPLPE